MPRAFATLLSVVGLFAVACGSGGSTGGAGAGQASGVVVLDEADSQLLAAFDEDLDTVRLLMVLSPRSVSCGAGLAAVTAEVLAALQSPKLRVMLVWTSVVPGDDLAAAREQGRKLASDPRVLQFWDADGSIGGRIARRLSVPSPHRAGHDGFAWDVYLVYPRGVRWGARLAPFPKLWMHQLDHVPPTRAPRLETGQLRDKLSALLADG